MVQSFPKHVVLVCTKKNMKGKGGDRGATAGEINTHSVFHNTIFFNEYLGQIIAGACKIGLDFSMGIRDWHNVC